MRYCHHIVAFVHAHQAHTLGASVQDTDFFDRGAGDDAVGGDEHYLLRRRNNPGIGQFAGLFHQLDCPDAAAGAVLFGIAVNLRQFAVTLGGNYQHIRTRRRNTHPDHFIIVKEFYTFHAAAGPLTGADTFHREADGLPFLRHHDHVILFGGNARRCQFIVFFHIHTDKPAAADGGKMVQRGLLDFAVAGTHQ